MPYAPGLMISFVLLVALGSFILLSPITDAQIQAAPGDPVGDSITLEVRPSSITIGSQLQMNLDPSNSPATLIKQITVTADRYQSWILTVYPEIYTASQSNGHAIEYRPYPYPNHGRNQLQNPLHILCEAKDIDLSTATQQHQKTLISGTGQQTFTITFEQPVSWDDVVLPSNEQYRITVMFVQTTQHPT